MDNDPDCEPEEFIDLTHPFRITFGKVIVYGNDMHAFAFERIQVCRQGGYEGFTFTRFHLGNSSRVENDAPEQLDIEMPHVDDAF